MRIASFLTKLSLFRATPETALRRPRVWIVIGPLLIFLFLSSGISIAGYSYFTYQVAAWHKAKEEELSAITNLKAAQVAAWHQERMADARAIFSSAMVQGLSLIHI